MISSIRVAIIISRLLIFGKFRSLKDKQKRSLERSGKRIYREVVVHSVHLTEPQGKIKK